MSFGDRELRLRAKVLRMFRIAGAALLAGVAAACVPRQVPPAPVPPPPLPARSPTVVMPRPASSTADWMDVALSPGDWRYRGETGTPSAIFASDGISLTLRCERSGTILFGLLGARSAALTIRTTYGERRLAATPAHLNETIATLRASDPVLDEMAFSRGRILVQAEGGRALIIPAWPEIARVAEDCRET